MLKSQFFGRKKYLEILKKRVIDLKDGYRQNIAIIGDEQIGKTSLIFKFLTDFYDPRIIPVYLESRPEPLDSFTRRFIGILLYNFLSNSGIKLQEDLNFLILKSEKYIPLTIRKIQEILTLLKSKKKKHNIFSDLLSLCETINEETQKFCVVILDEFHNLESLGIKNLYPDWSKSLITQKKTLYVIISSLKYKAKNILSKNLSLLFGNFEVITVEPFNIKVSEKYLQERLCGLNIKAGIKDFVVHFTGGNPFYLELLTKEILKAPNLRMAELLEELLFSPSGILNQKFTTYLKRFQNIANSQDFISIIYLIADGHNRIKDLTHLLHSQRKEIMAKANLLLELDTISRNGDFFKINDRVFSFWLKFVYQEKIHSLTFDAKNQKIGFKNKLEAMINEFLENRSKSLSERLSELMHLFENEVVHIGKKRLRLTQFREIKSLEFHNKRFKDGLIGRSSDTLWIIGLKQDVLTEEDVSLFVKECKKYRKQPKKIIVTINEPDSNTRLKAIEEKVWTWNLEKINQMLDLFAKPRIIA
ncbi:MAG: hypothetical protein DRP74_03890 [Candidatus Omnitrophota bacterium]|nr:MAG: hypothetical protein DRP74_03890 [Candidatus Omnitrophota bacterium]